MCRNFFPGISGGVLTPLTPPLDPPLIYGYHCMCMANYFRMLQEYRHVNVSIHT